MGSIPVGTTKIKKMVLIQIFIGTFLIGGIFVFIQYLRDIIGTWNVPIDPNEGHPDRL